MKSLTEYRVRSIQYAKSKYMFSNWVDITDEGSFYRIDDSHIFDKVKIKNIEFLDKRIVIHMTDQDVTLEAEEIRR